MAQLKNAFGLVAACAFALFAVLFGGYLVYEKVYLAVRTGITLERSGIVERALEPGSFWTSVTIYGISGTAIAVAGLYFLTWIIRTALKGQSSETS